MFTLVVSLLYLIIIAYVYTAVSDKRVIIPECLYSLYKTS